MMAIGKENRRAAPPVISPITGGEQEVDLLIIRAVTGGYQAVDRLIKERFS
jgi:hypothetical protein